LTAMRSGGAGSPVSIGMQLSNVQNRLSDFGDYYKRTSEDVFVILKKPSYLCLQKLFFHLKNNDLTSSEPEKPHNFYHAYGHEQMITRYFI